MHSDQGGFQPRSTAPVKVGDELEVTIEAVGAKGDGIAKKEGFVIFVPGVQKGDQVRIRITRVLKKVGFAELAGAASAASDEEGESAAAAEESDEGEEGEGEEGSEEDSNKEQSFDETEEAPEDSEDFGEEKQ